MENLIALSKVDKVKKSDKKVSSAKKQAEPSPEKPTNSSVNQASLEAINEETDILKLPVNQITENIYSSVQAVIDENITFI